MPSSDGLDALDRALQEKPQLTLSFYSYGILLHRLLPDGGETEYPISPEHLATALSTKVRFETGLLSGDTVYIASEGIRKVVIEYRKPQKTPIYLEGAETPLYIPLPGLLMLRTTVAHDNPQYVVYAVKRRPTTLTIPLFHTPLPNTSSGGVCWGSVKKVSPEGLASTHLNEDWMVFLGSVFTSHGCNGKSKSYPKDIREQLIALERDKARVYPTGDLLKLNLTLADVIRRNSHESTAYL